jgi:hypothetical protein
MFRHYRDVGDLLAYTQLTESGPETRWVHRLTGTTWRQVPGQPFLEAVLDPGPPPNRGLTRETIVRLRWGEFKRSRHWDVVES